MSGHDTTAIMRRFNDAFQQHDPSLLEGLIAANCVVENIRPAPDGDRLVGGAACLALWQGIAGNRETSFDLEEVIVCDDRAIIYWRYRWGSSDADSVRGVNLMRVRDGLIVEGRGYVKAA